MRKKWIGSLVLGIMAVFFVIRVQAACTMTDKWQLWEWIEYDNLIDVTFTERDTHFINTQDVQGQVNGLGTWAYPILQNSDVYTDPAVSSEAIKESNTHKNPRVIYLTFSEEVDVNLLDIDLIAKSSSGKEVEKQLYIDTALKKMVDGYYLPETAAPFYVWKENIRQQIQINQKVKSFLIMFEDTTEKVDYRLNYLQIPEYKVFRWTGEYVDYDTGYGHVTTEICMDSGEFSPNGSLWSNSAITSFAPSVKNTSIYNPIEKKGTILKDICREDQVVSGSKPGCIVDNSDPSGQGNTAIHGLADHIKDWQITHTQDGYGYYYSVLSNDTSDNEYIFDNSMNHTGVTYTAYPVHWSFNSDEANPIYTNASGKVERVVSNDAGGWCKHATGQAKAPCYKYEGHTIDSRSNAWDVQLSSYNNVYNDSDQVVYQTEYFLSDLLNPGNRKSLGIVSGNQVFNYEFKEHGVWQLDAEIMGINGLSEIISSDLFHIDLIRPFLTAEQPQGQWINKSVNVKLHANDNHSQIDYWKFRVTSDQGNSWGYQSNAITDSTAYYELIENGIYTIEATMSDKAGNQNTQQLGPFLIDQLAPKALNSSSITLLSNEKSLTDNSWINGEDDLTLIVSSLIDQPYVVADGEPLEVQCSGIKEVWAKVYTEKDGDDDAVVTSLVQNDNGEWQCDLGNLQNNHLLEDGKYIIEVYASDKAGNEALISTTSVFVDFTPPQIIATLQPENWTNKNVKVILSAVDMQSGLSTLEDVDGNKLDKELLIDHNQELIIYATDHAGNKAEKIINVNNIDKDNPEISVVPESRDWTNQNIYVNLSPQDHNKNKIYGVSGVRRWQYALSLDDGQTYEEWSEEFDDQYGNYQEHWTDWTEKSYADCNLDKNALLETETKNQWQKCNATWSAWSEIENLDVPLEDRRQKQEISGLKEIRSSAGELKRINDHEYTLDLPFGTKTIQLSAITDNPDLIISGAISGVGTVTDILKLTDFKEVLTITTKAPISGKTQEYKITTSIKNERIVSGTLHKSDAVSQLTDPQDRGQLAGKNGTFWIADFTLPKTATITNITVSAYQSSSDWGNMSRGDITVYYKTPVQTSWQYFTRFSQGGGGGVWQGTLTDITALSLYYSTKGNQNYYGYIDAMDINYSYVDSYADFSTMPVIDPPQTNTSQAILDQSKVMLYSYKIWVCSPWTDQSQTASNEMEKVSQKTLYRYRYYTGGKVIELNETGTYTIKTVVEDNAGNEAVTKHGAYKIDKVDPYAKISAKTTATRYDSLFVEPLDDHSGVDLWRFQISEDGGTSWFYDSGELKEKSAIYQLAPRQKYLIKVWIKDVAGNEAEELYPFVASIKAPSITAHDRWFFIGDDVSETELKKDVYAKDFDENDLTERVVIKNFEDLNTSVTGTTKIIYEVTDDNGLTTNKSVHVHVIDQNEPINRLGGYIRFISKEFLNTLLENSKWKTSELKILLEDSLNRYTPISTFKFSKKELDRIKTHNQVYGFNKEAYKQFFNEFAGNEE